jgi:hypothetical protein
MGSTSLSRHRPSLALLAARAVSAVGDHAAALALPLVALALTHDPRVLAVALAAGRIPVMLAPWWVSRLPGRLRTARMLPWWGLAQAGAAMLVPAAVWSGVLDDVRTPTIVTVVVVAALLLGSCDAVADSVGAAALCDLASTNADGTARVLSMDDLAGRVARLAGPALAAVIAVAWSPVAVLALDAASFLMAAPFTAWAVRGLMPDPAPAPHSLGRRLLPESVRRVLKEQPAVGAAWRLRGVGCFAWGGYSVGLPLLLADGPGPTAPRLAVVTFSYAAASLAGSGVLSARPVRSRLLLASVLAWAVVGACFLVMAWGATLPVLAAAAAVMGAAVPMANVTTTQQVAAVTSGEQRVLAMLTQTAVVNGASTAGLMLTGALISAVGARPVLALGGIGVLLAALLTGLSSTPRATRTPGRAA